MDINHYQEMAKEFAIYPGRNEFMGCLYTALGLAEESGEAAGKMKKAMRDDNCTITEDRREQALDEMGDVLWYISLYADELGYTLEQVAARNIEKLADRKMRGMIGGSGDKR